MRLRLKQLAVLAAMLLAGAAASKPAASADLLNSGPPPPAYMPPPEPVNMFAGWWIGATVGGGFATYDFSASSRNVDTSGVLGGGTAGWNWQSGPLVIGLEGDILGADVSGVRHFNFGANAAKPEIDAMGDLRLRAGVAITPQVLLFAAGGGSWADADLPITGPGGASRDGTFFGWNVGGGAEVAFTPNWHARFDYQFTDFESERVHYPGGNVQYDPDMSTYRGSLIYRF